MSNYSFSNYCYWDELDIRFIEVNRGIAFEFAYWGVWRESLKRANIFFWTDGKGKILAPVYEAATFKDGEELPALHHFRNISYEYASGLRAALRISPDSAQSAEFVFEGLLRWDREDKLCVCIPALTIPIPVETCCPNPRKSTLLEILCKVRPCPPPVVFLETHDWAGFSAGSYKYKSSFDSYELSYWFHETPQRIDYFSFSWLGGLRLISFGENLRISNCQFFSHYDIDVQNIPIGIEAGFDFQNNPWGRFSWLVRLRGGIFANFIRKTLLLKDHSFKNIRDFVDNKVQDTYLIEVTPQIMYRLKPFYFTLAYDYLGLYNVAFAPYEVQKEHPIHKIFSEKSLSLNSFQAGFGVFF